ncbi:MAG: TetR/AcrR family transcriptional regulator [Bacteroidota bacterium]|nr:TetR/AcrR family transcriptional regulator [Bacteroidota bacterium]
MTTKQEQILESALELFANEGYAATPTSKVANKAGVSEGLIFRHFTNKQGLLDALMKEAEYRLGELLGPILMETNPKKVIRRVIKMPFKLTSSRERDFWKLQYVLKWLPEYNKPEKMKPLMIKLSSAFKELKYKNAKKEAQLLYHTIENISSEILKGNMEQEETFRDFLLKKYKVYNS